MLSQYNNLGRRIGMSNTFQKKKKKWLPHSFTIWLESVSLRYKNGKDWMNTNTKVEITNDFSVTRHNKPGPHCRQVSLPFTQLQTKKTSYCSSACLTWFHVSDCYVLFDQQWQTVVINNDIFWRVLDWEKKRKLHSSGSNSHTETVVHHCPPFTLHWNLLRPISVKPIMCEIVQEA